MLLLLLFQEDGNTRVLRRSPFVGLRGCQLTRDSSMFLSKQPQTLTDAYLRPRDPAIISNTTHNTVRMVRVNPKEYHQQWVSFALFLPVKETYPSKKTCLTLISRHPSIETSSPIFRRAFKPSSLTIILLFCFLEKFKAQFIKTSGP